MGLRCIRSFCSHLSGGGSDADEMSHFAGCFLKKCVVCVNVRKARSGAQDQRTQGRRKTFFRRQSLVLLVAALCGLRSKEHSCLPSAHVLQGCSLVTTVPWEEMWKKTLSLALESLCQPSTSSVSCTHRHYASALPVA